MVGRVVGFCGARRVGLIWSAEGQHIRRVDGGAGLAGGVVGLGGGAHDGGGWRGLVEERACWLRGR